MVFLGLAFGWRRLIIKLCLASLAVIGWTHEYFGGDHVVCDPWPLRHSGEDQMARGVNYMSHETFPDCGEGFVTS